MRGKEGILRGKDTAPLLAGTILVTAWPVNILGHKYLDMLSFQMLLMHISYLSASCGFLVEK